MEEGDDNDVILARGEAEEGEEGGEGIEDGLGCF